MTYEFWPDWIPPEKRRAWIGPSEMNKLARIDGILCASYVARQETLGKPITHKLVKGGKRYRLLEIFCRAKAEAVLIEPPKIISEPKKIKELTEQRHKLQRQVEALDMKRRKNTHHLNLQHLSNKLTNQSMLTPKQIVEAALPFDKFKNCGVYFLIRDDEVVYVGQSVNIESRIRQHGRFDSYAFICCKPEELNVLESLYIHALNPKDQGRTFHGELVAPMSFDRLVKQLNRGP